MYVKLCNFSPKQLVSKQSQIENFPKFFVKMIIKTQFESNFKKKKLLGLFKASSQFVYLKSPGTTQEHNHNPL
jgi:hypothetical protein